MGRTVHSTLVQNTRAHPQEQSCGVGRRATETYFMSHRSETPHPSGSHADWPRFPVSESAVDVPMR